MAQTLAELAAQALKDIPAGCMNRDILIMFWNGRSVKAINRHFKLKRGYVWSLVKPYYAVRYWNNAPEDKDRQEVAQVLFQDELAQLKLLV